MNATDYLFHYVHHKDLTVGLGNKKELKEKLIHWIQHSTKEERLGFGEIMLHKQMMLDEWLDKFGASDGQVDELVVYVLSQMLREPIAVITKTCFWSSVKGGSEYIGDTNIVFAFGGEGCFIPLERATVKDPGICHCTDHIHVCINICILNFRCVCQVYEQPYQHQYY